MARKFSAVPGPEYGMTGLQWDRAFDGAEISPQLVAAGGIIVLQWDRAFDGAEIHRNSNRTTRSHYASMGPRL